MTSKLFWLAALGLVTGCAATAPYRTARTLAHGEHEVAASLSGAYLAADAVTWATGTPLQPTKDATTRIEGNAVPEIGWHYGVLPNLEAGARVGGGGLLTEVDARYRFVQTGPWHVAAGLAAGETWEPSVRGGRVVVPVVASVDLTPSWGLTAAAHAGWRWLSRPDLDPHALPKSMDDHRFLLGHDSLEVGAGLGADWQGAEGPLGQLLVTATHWSGGIGVGTETEYDVWAFQVVLSGGLRFGKEKAEMERAEKEMERKLRDGEPFKTWEKK